MVRSSGEFEIRISSAGISGDPDKLLIVKDHITGLEQHCLIDVNSWFFNWRLKTKTKRMKETLLLLRGDHL